MGLHIRQRAHYRFLIQVEQNEALRSEWCLEDSLLEDVQKNNIGIKKTTD